MSKKIPHIIGGLKQTSRPRYMCFFDSEARVNMNIVGDDVKALLNQKTIVRKHDTYLICATFIDKHTETNEVYHSDGFKYRFACDINNKLPAKQSMWVFAHNAKYDIIATGLIHNLCRLGWLVSSFSDDNPCIVELKHEASGRRLIILSTTNYFQTSLKGLGETFGLEKMEAAFNDTLEKSIIYCQRDVEIIKVAIIYLLDLLQTEDLCGFRRTIASLAFKFSA